MKSMLMSAVFVLAGAGLALATTPTPTPPAAVEAKPEDAVLQPVSVSGIDSVIVEKKSTTDSADAGRIPIEAVEDSAKLCLDDPTAESCAAPRANEG